MNSQCEVCNQTIEAHLARQHKKQCFSCLTEELSGAGVVATFSIKEKPIQANCAVCDLEASGHELYPAPWGFICRWCREFCETQAGVSWDLVKLTAQHEWLVKANSRIQGPFTNDEIVSRLEDNRLVSLDEIMRPLGRWRLLRDEEVFRSIVNEIKNKGSLKNKSLEVTSGGLSDTERQQQTSTLDVENETPFATISRGLERASVTSATEPINDSRGSRDLIRNFAYKNEINIQKEVKYPNQKKSLIALGLFIIIGVFAAVKLITPRDLGGTRNHSFEVIMESALRNEKAGDYQKALSLFNEARTYKPNDSELLLHLAPLTLIYDRQTMQASRMFKEILDTEKGPNYQKAANLGLGLIALDSHELKNAEDYFDRSIALDPDYVPAIANRAIVSFYKGELDNAEALLVKALTKGGPEGAIVISLADVSAAQVEANGSQVKERRSSLWQTHEMLDAFLSLERDYEQEVLIQDARIFTLMKMSKEAASRIDALLDVDPEKSDLHVRDWGIFRGRASWGMLLDSLKKISQELPSTPRMTAAIGLAMYRGREKLDGAQSIEQALAQAPHDPLLMALAGWVEMKLGRRDSGVVNIKKASLLPDKYKLPHILQARLCQEDNDFECAQRQWQIVHDIDLKSVEALYGLASVEWQRHNTDGAVSWLRQAQAMDPTYAPLLLLSQEIQNAPAKTPGGG